MEIKENEHYNVTVVKVMERGAVVSISGMGGKTGFIHISKLSDAFVSNINDYISIGETYDAICCDEKKLAFSVKHLNLKPKYTSAKQHHTETKYSLDDMIARADASLKDKQRHQSVPKSNGHRRRQRRDKPDMMD